jgi:hypothetical protein
MLKANGVTLMATSALIFPRGEAEAAPPVPFDVRGPGARLPQSASR